MDPQEFARIGHRVVDQLAEYFATVPDKRVFPDTTPASIARLFTEGPPAEGIDSDEVLLELEQKLLPYCTHTGNGGYLGLITASPLPIGVIGDFIASALNQNLGVYSIGPSAVELERQTVRWLCDLAGYGPGSFGSLTSGGMLANLIGLKLARDQASSGRAQYEGLRGDWAVYVSEERHVSVDKAADAVGLGRDAVRPIPVDEHFRVRLDALEQRLAEDAERGVRPACIVALAGSTNTGAVDDLVALRRIADRVGAWLHADAAYGGGMLLSTKYPGVLSGVELADSITIDPHKWFYAPVDAGAVLVRDGDALRRSFAIEPSYLTDEFEAEGERFQFYVHGLEQSRRFRALKVWMSLKRYGTCEIGRWVDANVDQARLLHQLAEEHPRLRSAVLPPMSAACVRWVPERPLDERAVCRLHQLAAQRIEEQGEFWIGTTRLADLDWFRACSVNFRTTERHIRRLVEVLARICAELEEELS